MSLAGASPRPGRAAMPSRYTGGLARAAGDAVLARTAHGDGDGNVRIRHQVVVFDAAELAPESAFWAGVLGGTVDAEDYWHMVRVDGERRIAVQLAPDHVRPGWPDGVPQQVHLDLWVDDFPAADAQVRALGATVLKEAEETDAPDNFQVYSDPAGHPFCLCWLTAG
jgi:predicted enzyme related to lactoylglutathione lyase